MTPPPADPLPAAPLPEPTSAATTVSGRALAASEARYRAIVEEQTELISLASPDGTLCFVNPAYARHFGHEPAQMVGRSLHDFVDAADRDAVRQHLQAVCAGRQAVTGVNRSLSASGSLRWLSWTNRPVVDASDQVVLLQSVGRDITDQHLAETRLQDALRDKETLLKEVHHRVKNNLQVVYSLLGLQQRHVVDGGARRALDECARRVRAMALVHEKLYQSGTLSDLSLRDYTRELLSLVDEQSGASQRQIRLHDEIDDIRCPLHSAIPFGLLVTELVCNAIEHGFAGRSQGTVQVQLLQQAGAVQLQISDDGVGLAPDFDPAQAASMGLQLATMLARQLGGELAALRQAGSGSGAHFCTALPRL